PLQKVLELYGFVVFIDAEETDIEVVARIFEIVGVAAEEGDVFFGGEDEANVGVLFVLVEVVLAALKEGDDVAAEARFVEVFFFDVVDYGAAGELRVGGGLAGLYGVVDLAGDVFDVHQDVELKVYALELVGGGLGEVAGFDQVARFGAHFGEGVGTDMMIGHHEAIR